MRPTQLRRHLLSTFFIQQQYSVFRADGELPPSPDGGFVQAIEMTGFSGSLGPSMRNRHGFWRNSCLLERIAVSRESAQ
jgi:hypothetical protein